jgi:5'-nucleotidase
VGGDRLRPLADRVRAAGQAVARVLPSRRGAPDLAGGLDGTVAGGEPALPPAEERELPQRPDNRVAIRILAVTDFHGALLSAGERDGRPAGGAAYLAACLRRERAARPGRTLLLHNGDVVGLSPAVSGLLQDEPAVAVCNAIGLDAGVLGNHEFDEGLDELFRLLDGGTHPATLWRSGSFPGSAFPWLAANVVSEATGHPILPAYRVFDLAGVRVGVVGVVSTDTPRLIGGGALGLRFVDEAATVNRYVAELRDGPEQVAVVVVLAHLGGTLVQPGQPGGPIAGPIARFAAGLAGGVDVVVAGHVHAHSYATTIAGTLVVQGPPFGAAYAAVDLEVDPEFGQVVDRSATLVPVWQDAVAPDPEVAAIVARARAEAVSLAGERVAVATGAYQRAPSAGATDVSLGDLVADAFLRAAGSDVAAVHPGEVRADLPAGPVTRGDVYAVLPGGHRLVVVDLTADQLRRFLEEQWTRQRTSRLHLAGVVAEVEPEAIHGRRLRRLRLADGRPLERGQTYTVAMTSFLAGGGDGFRVPLEAEDRLPGPPALDALVAHLRDPVPPTSVEARSSRVDAGDESRTEAAASAAR